MGFSIFAIFSLHKNSSLHILIHMKKMIYSILGILGLFSIGYFLILFSLPLSLPRLPSSTIFQDTKGQFLGEVIYSGSVRHEDIAFEEIPDFYKKSLVTLEDRTFWTNNGVSFRGIVRSAVHNIEALSIVE